MANVTAERLRDLIGADLDALEAIVHWNHAHGIEVFRLTSNLIPFGSPPRTSSRGERTRSPLAALDRATVARQSLPRTAVPARC
jgi:UV DNA damage repair endonuclease